MLREHKHSIEIGADGIAYVTIVGDGDKKDAEGFVADAQRVFDTQSGRVINAVIDMVESGESTYDGVLVYKDFLRNPQLGKLAFILRDNDLLKFLVSLAVSHKKKDVKIFSSKKDAQEWIRIQGRG